MSVGYWIFFLVCGVVGCLTSEIQTDDLSPLRINDKTAVTTTKSYVKPGITPSNLSGQIFKDFYKNIYKKFVAGYVALYGPNAINRIDPGARKEEDEDRFCVDEEDNEQLSFTTIQVDVLGQMFKYLTKYIVKKSFTPFSFVKTIFKYFGFITSIEKPVQRESFNVIDVDPLTTLFTNIQRFFDSYENVEKKEEETKLINKLARTSVEINKPGLTKGNNIGSNKPCVLKNPQELWDDIMPYEPSLIISNLLMVAAWMVAFWAPILPVLFSFPSQNGLGGFATDDGDNRREQHVHYNSYGSQYVHDDHGFGIDTDKHAQNDLKTHINNHDDGIQDDAQAQEMAVSHNVFVFSDNGIDDKEVSSYTYYDVNDVWHNNANMR